MCHACEEGHLLPSQTERYSTSSSKCTSDLGKYVWPPIQRRKTLLWILSRNSLLQEIASIALKRKIHNSERNLLGLDNCIVCCFADEFQGQKEECLFNFYQHFF